MEGRLWRTWAVAIMAHGKPTKPKRPVNPHSDGSHCDQYRKGAASFGPIFSYWAMKKKNPGRCWFHALGFRLATAAWRKAGAIKGSPSFSQVALQSCYLIDYTAWLHSISALWRSGSVALWN